MLALAGGEERMVLAVNDAHIERFRMARVALQRMARHQRADDLAMIGVNKDARLHGASHFNVGTNRNYLV